MKTSFPQLTALVLSLVLLAGCNNSIFEDKPPVLSNTNYIRTQNNIRLPSPTGTGVTFAEGSNYSVWIDTGNIENGYISASCTAPKKTLLDIRTGNDHYTYFLSSGGETNHFPLTMGNGNYTFTVGMQMPDGMYQVLLTHEAIVNLTDSFSPYLLPNSIVNYEADDTVVALAHELTKHASNDIEIIQQVYYWVANNIAYDDEKATAMVGVSFDKMPDLAQTIQLQKGICIDYAALTAALLRINGIPCKLEIGRVQRADGTWISHAWNSVWITEKGNISTNLTAEPHTWNRIDLTLLAENGYIAYKTITNDGYYFSESIH